MRAFTSVVLVGCLSGWGCGSDDDMMPMSKECEDGARATSDSYFPYDVGNIWRYRVTKGPTDMDPSVKRQEIEPEMVPDGRSEPVLVQRTLKGDKGMTVSWIRRDGDTLIRLRQEDYDGSGLLERITTYEPYKLRFDSTPDRLVTGVEYEDTYTRIVTDSTGLETSRTEITDLWKVVADNVECTSGWGETLACLHIRRVRQKGGFASKEFYFSRGYGKVLEIGAQNEELIGCTLE